MAKSINQGIEVGEVEGKAGNLSEAKVAQTQLKGSVLAIEDTGVTPESEVHHRRTKDAELTGLGGLRLPNHTAPGQQTGRSVAHAFILTKGNSGRVPTPLPGAAVCVQMSIERVSE